MPSIDDIYGSNDTLRATHLPANQSVRVAIERVQPKRFDDGGKLEMKFVGKQRVLLVNKTNASLIAKFLRTPDYTTWAGQTIWLKAAETEFKGEIVPCIRVDLHPPQPVGPAPSAAPTGEVQYVPDDPSDPGGFRAETAAMAPGQDVPF